MLAASLRGAANGLTSEIMEIISANDIVDTDKEPNSPQAKGPAELIEALKTLQ